MLSGILKSQRAVKVNTAMMRAFVLVREMLLKNAKIAAQLRDIEERMYTQEMNTIIIMDKLRTLTSPAKAKQRKIGFNSDK